MLVSRTPIRESMVMAFTTPQSLMAPAGGPSPAPADLPAGEVTFLFTDTEGALRVTV